VNTAIDFTKRVS